MIEAAELPRTAPIICRPGPGESPLSFLSRVTWANRYESVVWLFQNRPRLRWDSGRWPHETVAHLATLTGTGPAFSKACYRPHRQAGRLDDQRHILGSRAPAQLIEFGQQKYCPHCLEEDGFNAAFFDLTAVEACPRHQVRLLDACPTCQAPTTWGRPNIFVCHACDTDLRSAPAIPIAAAQIEGTAVIATRFGFRLAQGAPTPAWPAEAEHLDLGESIELLAILARLATDHRDPDAILRFIPGEGASKLQVGYEQLRDWPNGYFRCLDAIADAAPADHRAQASRHKLFGFARVYGEFYTRLAGAEHEPFLLLRRAFAAYSAQQTKTPITGRRDGAVYTADDVSNRPIVTPKEAEALIGRKYYSVKKLLAAGALTAAIQIGGERNRVFLNRSQLEEIAAGGPPLVKKETADRLGVSMHKLDQFIEHRIVVPLVAPEDEGTAHYLFTVTTIDALIGMVRAGLRPDPSFVANTPMSTMLRGQETLRTSPVPVFDAIARGELAVRGWDDTKTGLAGALFNNREVDRFLHLRHDIELGDREGLTGLRVSHILRVNPMTVTWFLEKDVLCRGTGATTKKPRIERASLEAMQRDLITISEIAPAYRTNGTIIAKALDKAGIRPLHEVDNDCGILLYERTVVEALDFSSLIRSVGRKAGRTAAEYKRLWKADHRRADVEGRSSPHFPRHATHGKG